MTIDPPTPVAARRPHTLSAHGETWSDDYAWIRADNWREVLRDPATLPADIRALLEAENAYCDAVLAPTLPLQKALVGEMRARLKEDDREPPQVDGPFAYYSRFRDGGQRRLYCRTPRDGGEETILLDGDARAAGKPFYQIGAARHAPDHTKFAWTEDALGSEIFVAQVRDLARGEYLPDRIANVTGGLVWTRDSRRFLYVEQDENHRPHRLMLHRLGTEQGADVEIFVEKDPAWFLSIELTRLGRSAIIDVHGHDGSEAHLIDLDNPTAEPILVAPRRQNFFYDVMDHGERLYIRTNAGGARDFKIVAAPRATPGEAHWTDVAPHREGCFIADATLFADHLLTIVREDARPRLVVHDLGSGETHDVAFEDETYALHFERVYEFSGGVARFSVSSLARAQETYDYALRERRRTLVKMQWTPPGFDPAHYVTRLVFATAPDGARVPISLVHKHDLALNGAAPLLLYGYGAYGYAIEAAYAPNRFSLVDRGFVYAIAHVRGGSDKGWGWYEDGKLASKPNTFSDFLACARHLIGLRYTSAGRIVAQGGSAGGLLMGAVANMMPELFGGVVAEVPFVDVLATILDDSLPLTPPEWVEWGDPIRDRAAFDAIRAYSPYDNVRPQPYPPIFAVAGLTDPRVTYWEPAKWVARLRATMTGGGPILLRTAMDAGHGGASGRFDRLEEVARAYAFAFGCVEGAFSASEA